MPAYKESEGFHRPDGVTDVEIDPETLRTGHAGLPDDAQRGLYYRH